MQTKNLFSLFTNPIFLSGALSLLLAQIVKACISAIKFKKFNAQEIALTMIWKTGGMPSSHAAVMVSLSASIALIEGFNSLFILSFFMGLIVIRDALGVRRSAGLQSKALNVLGKQVSEHLKLDFVPLKEIHGHKWPEVLVGSALGFIVSILLCQG